jgi:adenosine deaminase
MSDLLKRPTPEQVKRLPKALLHDHLDGGLRPQTIIDIANEIGYDWKSLKPRLVDKILGMKDYDEMYKHYSFVCSEIFTELLIKTTPKEA